MSIVANCRLNLIKRDVDKNVSTQVDTEEELEFEITGKHKEKFDKAPNSEIKRKILQSYLQSPMADKIIGKKMNDKEYNYFWRELEVLSFDYKTEDTPEKASKKGRPKKKVI